MDGDGTSAARPFWSTPPRRPRTNAWMCKTGTLTLCVQRPQNVRSDRDRNSVRQRTLLDAMPPFLGGGAMIDRVTTSGFEPAELPEKFEAGTPPIAEAIGLEAALLHQRSWLERH